MTHAPLEIKGKLSKWRVKVDCARLISELIQEVGCDSAWVDQEINDDNFPAHRPKCKCHSSISPKRIYLVNYEREVSTDQVLESLRNEGLFPGGLREYLSLVVAHPGLRERIAVSLGSDLSNVSQPSGDFVGAVSAWGSNSGGICKISIVLLSSAFRWGSKAWFVAVDVPSCGCPK